MKELTLEEIEYIDRINPTQKQREFLSKNGDLVKKLFNARIREFIEPPVYDNPYKKRISVAKLDFVTGEVLGKYQNIAEASRVNKINHDRIRQVIAGVCDHAGGYKWVQIEKFKICKDCQSKLPLESFSTNGKRQTKSGEYSYKNICKPCHSKRIREYRKIRKATNEPR